MMYVLKGWFIWLAVLCTESEVSKALDFECVMILLAEL
jgi:hypothetical protein